MNRPVTIDASVLVSAFIPSEPAHRVSKAFLEAVQRSETPILLPTLALVEIAAAIGRGQSKPDLGCVFAQEIRHLPRVVLVGLDEQLAQEAAEVAAYHRLRSGDAVYVAVARRFAAILVTLDREQLERATGVVPVLRPENVL